MSRQSQPQEDRPDDSNWTPEARAEYEQWCKEQDIKYWKLRYMIDEIDEQEKT